MPSWKFAVELMKSLIPGRFDPRQGFVFEAFVPLGVFVAQIPFEQIVGRLVAAKRRHEVGELERDDLLGNLSRSFEFEPEVAPVGGGKLDRHVAVERFEIGPNGDAVLLAQLGDALDELWSSS